MQGVRADMETAVTSGFHHILFTQPSQEILEAVRAYLQEAWRFDEVDWQLTHAAADGNVVLTERIDNFVINGRPVSLPIMGAFEVRKSKWSALADVMYLNVGANDGGEVPLTTSSGASLDLKVDAGVKVRGWVLTFLGGYNVYDTPQASVDLIAGARYLELKLDFDLGLQGRPLQDPIELAALGAVWDGVVGVRGQAKLEGNWYLPFYLDVGTGESDLTWQAAGGLVWDQSWGNVKLYYRHLAYDQSGDKLIQSLSFSGPEVGVNFSF